MPNWDDYAEEARDGGGLLLAYEGKTADVYFGPGKYGEQLTIDVLLDHPEDHPQIPDGIIHNWFSLPKGWESEKNGSIVVYRGEPAKDGSMPTKFWASSGVGRLVTQMRTIDPEGNTLLNGTPQEAAYWKKSLAHARWGAVNTPKRVQDDTGKWGMVQGGKDVSMPVELLTQNTVSNGHAAVDLSTLAPADVESLTTAATSAASHADWIAKLTQVPGMVGSDAFKAATGPQGPAYYEAVRPA